MKNFNTGLLIILALLSVGVLFKLFQFDDKYKQMQTELTKVNEQLNKAVRLSNDAEKEIDILIKKIGNDYLKELKALNSSKNKLVNDQRMTQKEKELQLQKINKEIRAIESEHNLILKELEDDED